MSRSTWACELKYYYANLGFIDLCHAPRERVSWNPYYFRVEIGDRVTLHVSVWVEIYIHLIVTLLLAVTLHVSVWVEILASKAISHFSMSRSTWACELKLNIYFLTNLWPGHAPRERVSWNLFPFNVALKNSVTLHVSVWVEMLCW